MYTYVSAIARVKGGGVEWKSIDLSTIPLYQVYNTYSEIKATVTNPAYSSAATVDFDDLPDYLRVLTITFVTWLGQIGNTSLPVTYSVLVEGTTTVRHVDAFYWGFKSKPSDHTKSPDAVLDYDQQVDILLSKTGVNYSNVEQNCIATVNGFCHRISSTSDGVYVLDGVISARKANKPLVGFLDFSGIGSITQVDITSDMVVDPEPDVPSYESVYVKTNVDLFGKTVLLSWMGYLFALDNNYDVVGNRMLKINTRNMDLVSRYFDSRNYIDWSDVYVPYESDHNPDRVNLDIFLSDDTITKMLNSPQTFLIVVDATNVVVEYAAMQPTGLPGVYIQSDTAPTEPMRVNMGRLAEYVVEKEIDDYVVVIDGYLVDQSTRHTVSASSSGIVNNSLVGPQPRTYAEVRRMDIKRIELVTA